MSEIKNLIPAFEPESEEVILGRLPKALEYVYTIEETARMELGREHIFDFTNGARLILTREAHAAGISIHASVGVHSDKAREWLSLPTWGASQRMRDILKFIRPVTGKDTPDQIEKSDRCFHFFYRVG